MSKKFSKLDVYGPDSISMKGKVTVSTQEKMITDKDISFDFTKQEVGKILGISKKKLPHRRVVKALQFQYTIAECPECKRWVAADILNATYIIKTFCDFCKSANTYELHPDQIQNFYQPTQVYKTRD